MEAKVTWRGRMSFTGSADSGFTVPLGAVEAVGGDNDGFRPLELMLISLAGCTAMDVISILRKKKTEVDVFEVKVSATRADQHPMVFESAEIEYILKGKEIERTAVERAVELSETKYCPAQAMLGKTIKISHRITIN